jgi:predicted DNA-binding transcriptional regulator AlpA
MNSVERWWEGLEPPAEPVLIRMSHITSRIPACRSTVYNWIRRGQFPRPRIIIGNRSFWHEHEFEAWRRGMPPPEE